MGRWTQYDEVCLYVSLVTFTHSTMNLQDDYRLPEGMKRVGYDADTQRYTFQKSNQIWLGEPGAEYGGTLSHAGTASGACHPTKFRV